MYLNMENSVLALKLIAMVLIGEFYVKVLLLANVHAYHLLFESGYEHTGAYHQRLMLGSAAFKLHPVNGAGIVKLYLVAIFNGALNVYHASNVLTLTLDLGIDHFVCNIILLLFNFYTLVLAQRDLRHNGNDSFKRNIFSFLGAEYGYIRPVHRLYVMLLDSRLVHRRICFVKSIIDKNVPSVSLLNNSLGSMSLAEAGNRDGLAQLKIRLVNSLVKILGTDGHAQLYLVALKLFKTCHNILRTINYRITPADIPPSV